MMKKIALLFGAMLICVMFTATACGGDPFDEEDGNTDPDNDGLLTWEENVLGTDPYNSDSDNDGLPDFWEYINLLDPSDPSDAHLDFDWLDTENAPGERRAAFDEVRKSIDVWPTDGITTVYGLVLNEGEPHYDNYEEYYRAYLDDSDRLVYIHTSPIDPDTDDDGQLDPDDPNPLKWPTDGTTPGGDPGDGGANDSPEGDSDDEGENDSPNPDQPPDDDDSPTDPDKPGPPGPPTPTTDTDGDLVPDLDEIELLTDPNDWDTDNDHLADCNEGGNGLATNALVTDTDNDGI